MTSSASNRNSMGNKSQKTFKKLCYINKLQKSKIVWTLLKSYYRECQKGQLDPLRPYYSCRPHIDSLDIHRGITDIVQVRGDISHSYQNGCLTCVVFEFLKAHKMESLSWRHRNVIVSHLTGHLILCWTVRAAAKKISKLHIALCEENPHGTYGFSSKRFSKAEGFLMQWRLHVPLWRRCLARWQMTTWLCKYDIYPTDW